MAEKLGKDKGWDEMSGEEKVAAAVLGWDEGRWQAGESAAACATRWEALEEAQRKEMELKFKLK